MGMQSGSHRQKKKPRAKTQRRKEILLFIVKENLAISWERGLAMSEKQALEYRVDTLEALLGEFIVHTRVAIKSLSNETISLSKEMKDFKDNVNGFVGEMKDFKDEMKDFKDEMKDFKDEMKDFKDEMKDFKDEMKDFKDEMKDFKVESQMNRREMNRQWGDLARKMGTIVEDIIAPAVRPVIRKYFEEDVVYFAVNVKKHRKDLGLKGEFDVLAAGETRFFLIEVKSTPKEAYLDDFIENIDKFKKLFPEYADMPLVPIFGSIRFEESFIPLATQRGIYLLAYREWDYMDILNFDQISGKE